MLSFPNDSFLSQEIIVSNTSHMQGNRANFWQDFAKEPSTALHCRCICITKPNLVSVIHGHMWKIKNVSHLDTLIWTGKLKT